MENKGKYYITTAIAYTSGKPHIGNVYEIVLADAIARYKRLVGYDVRFQTGTDEHGQKIEDKAKEANKTPQEYVDGVAEIIKQQFDGMNVSYDKFMRTTDPYHEKQVQKIFKKLYEQGDIYKSEYEGLYCKDCESFFTESQLIDGKCPDCGRAVEPAKEEAYFFKMSKYADRLMKHIEENPHFIQPESRKNEMVNNFIKPGLQDLCVSRTSFKWGIPVDFDPKHVVYVWIDALTNYITGLGFDLDGNHDELFKHYWPADVHLIGKDILRFHTIYWPIMLMALDIELPKQVFGHPWLLVGEGKMSKSKGNVIYADDLSRYFGVDAVRYIMLHEMPFAQDGTVTYELMIERINSDLANIFGNLVNRTISMTNKYFNGLVENTKCVGEFDEELIQVANDTVIHVDKKMDELKVADAIDEIITLLRRSNKYIDETTPWSLGKDEAQHDRLKTVLYNLLESIRIAAILMKPFLPETSEKILNQINTNKRDYESIQNFGQLESGIHVTDKPEILFARLDEKEILETIEAETVKPQVKVSKLPEITIDDFAKVEMVVGQVISCQKHPKADKLLVSQIDIGGEMRQIVSGIAQSYKPEDMVGKKVVVIINLKPANLRGVESQGMILAGATDKKIEVLNIQDLPLGTQVR
ncbi:methionine--tRNA ligase [Anaerorhabdus furcosa]|uniref:Methionine--tRNA ligase n=1 Tax=Anaerorhabdus furcosa TaxID=118967 RepID=A0A1T4KLZ6_9FIRM|nr:methionine--tRNA ligase [Anaerorhabdus furcosa]SJZ43408.1 methionyl-tRNA synthetase [Anaerorhabdus furcosa]